MTIENYKKIYDQADEFDRREGKLAYERYNIVMHRFADHYGFDVVGVTEAFVALSPNSDYHGNLRSLASVLDGVANGVPDDRITVSTFNACKNRALTYLRGEVDFLSTVKGKKITSFRHNILHPHESREVTVDGHMIAAWFDKPKMTMKEANLAWRGKVKYEQLAEGCILLADEVGIAPCEMQATIWFCRKRIFNRRFNPQLSLLAEKDDANHTMCWPADFPPYAKKRKLK